MDLPRAQRHPAVVLDALAVVALLVATLTLHAGSVLIAFGTRALASGLLQLVQAWHAERSRQVQPPLIISGVLPDLDTPRPHEPGRTVNPT